jgi:transcription termination/antitermination protein NusG
MMLNPTPSGVEYDIAIGDTVDILSGSMENQQGVVEDIDTVRGKIKVSVQMFGRATPAELDLTQVKKAE